MEKGFSAQPRLSNTVKPADMGLEEWQTALRRQQAERERFVIGELGPLFSQGEFQVRNPKTRSQYKVIYRGAFSPWNYCSCPDFRTSGLGTCKHVEGVKLWLQQQGRTVEDETPDYTSVYIDYHGERSVRLRLGMKYRREMAALASAYFDTAYVLLPDAYTRFDTFLEKARAIDPLFRCYPDALEEVIGQRERLARAELIDKTYTDEKLAGLLSTTLYPYQKEGVRFAVKAGKAIIADEMGLGKTVQAIACAEIYLRERMAESVLIVCPNSLKYQWRREIERFASQPSVIIEGYASRRLELYKSAALYKIVSYQSLANDIKSLGRLQADLLIMDEVQRLKNWNTQLAQAVRRIDAHYSVLLSGTPLENKLDELVSIVQLADPYVLAPLYRFRYDHILTDPNTGKPIGYKNLGDIREKLKDTLIRRTRESVRLQLPKRTDQFLLVPMTGEQSRRHEELKNGVARLVSKWQRTNGLSEEERRRLLVMLGQMRMLADSTFVIDQNQDERHDVKVGEALNIIEEALSSNTAKVVVFSEWERMARLVATELDARGIRYEFLHGNIPAKKRDEIIGHFQEDDGCRVFLSTDTGSTGLNLQAANTLLNLDLPWNPAVLEQRIGRIYRIGQEMPVQVISLVSKDSIEESMIERLRFKRSMFEGALDGGDDTIFLSDDKFRGFMGTLSQAFSLERHSSIAEQAPSSDPSPEEEGPFAAAPPSSSEKGSGEETMPDPVESFLSSLRDILRSPEKTKRLADAIDRILGDEP